MFKNLWIKFFLLLTAVSLIALSSALLLRELMISDFRKYLEGEMEDRVYWVTASLERTYEKYSGWERDKVVSDTVWALMLGFHMRLYDKDGSLVIDTGQAVDSLSPLVKKRVAALSELRDTEDSARFVPYALFLGGNEIGQLEVSVLRPGKESLFIRRSNMMLLLSLLLLGGSAIFLSLVFSKKLTKPVKGLTEGVTAISEGNLKKRVVIPGKDEIGMLSHAFNRMAQTLETQESLRKKITANIAHELRTPMSIIRGELEGMMDGFIPTDREHLESLYAEIKRLMHILEGIEELARAEASSLTLRKQTVDLATFNAGGWGLFWTCFFTIATYINAGWMREQVCIYMCPYARFQSVMFDRDTLIVSYDERRGEPRGSRKKNADRDTLGLGDCIDCRLCVQVCPTGIDIRNGLQYQCITCALCIDACNSVMDKMSYPRGLIRYTTENSLEGRPSRILRPRLIGYIVAVLALSTLFVTVLLGRIPVGLDAIRERGQLYREVSGGLIENVYTLKIRNMSQAAATYALSVSGLPDVEIIGETEVSLDAGEVFTLPVALRMPRDSLGTGNVEVVFEIQSTTDERVRDAAESRFLGPAPGG